MTVNIPAGVADPLLEQAALGNVSEALLAQLEPFLDTLLSAVDKRIMGLILAGPLDPDAAVQAWIEKAAYLRLRNLLRMKARVGHNASVRVDHLLNKGALND